MSSIYRSHCQVVGERDSATLVRGVDTHGRCDLESPPEGAFHPAAVARHAEIIARQTRFMYAGASQAGKCAAFLPILEETLNRTAPSAAGGQFVILGKTDVNREVRRRFGALMGERRIIRSSYGGARPARDFPWLANLYLQGRLMLDELVSMRLPLDRINDGFDAMRRGEIVRAVVEFPA